MDAAGSKKERQTSILDGAAALALGQQQHQKRQERRKPNTGGPKQSQGRKNMPRPKFAAVKDAGVTKPASGRNDRSRTPLDGGLKKSEQFYEANGVKIPLYDKTGRKRAHARLGTALAGRNSKPDLLGIVRQYAGETQVQELANSSKKDIGAWIERVETLAWGPYPKNGAAVEAHGQEAQERDATPVKAHQQERQKRGEAAVKVRQQARQKPVNAAAISINPLFRASVPVPTVQQGNRNVQANAVGLQANATPVDRERSKRKRKPNDDDVSITLDLRAPRKPKTHSKQSTESDRTTEKLKPVHKAPVMPEAQRVQKPDMVQAPQPSKRPQSIHKDQPARHLQTRATPMVETATQPQPYSGSYAEEERPRSAVKQEMLQNHVQYLQEQLDGKLDVTQFDAETMTRHPLIDLLGLDPAEHGKATAVVDLPKRKERVVVTASSLTAVHHARVPYGAKPSAPARSSSPQKPFLKPGKHGWDYELHKWGFDGDKDLATGRGHQIEHADQARLDKDPSFKAEFDRKYPGSLANQWPCGCQMPWNDDDSEEES